MVDYYFWLLVIPSPDASDDVTTHPPLFCFVMIMDSSDGWVVPGDYRKADIPSADGGMYNELE